MKVKENIFLRISRPKTLPGPAKSPLASATGVHESVYDSLDSISTLSAVLLGKLGKFSVVPSNLTKSILGDESSRRVLPVGFRRFDGAL